MQTNLATMFCSKISTISRSPYPLYLPFDRKFFISILQFNGVTVLKLRLTNLIYSMGFLAYTHYNVRTSLRSNVRTSSYTSVRTFSHRNPPVHSLFIIRLKTSTSENGNSWSFTCTRRYFVNNYNPFIRYSIGKRYRRKAMPFLFCIYRGRRATRYEYTVLSPRCSL